VLGSDPAVKEAGVDPGYTFGGGKYLRAPDVGVGNVPNKPGWIEGVPEIAVEYASVGQDEDQLQLKISELLTFGTRYVWVVRLVGPRRVEVYTRGQPVFTATPGQSLTAPGILQNPVRVEALYDPEAAHEATLRNLLQRRGVESLEEALAASRKEGTDAGLLMARRQVLAMLVKFPLDAGDRERIASCTEGATLDAWIVRATTARSRDELFGR
jgi:hypothetical protein